MNEMQKFVTYDHDTLEYEVAVNTAFQLYWKTGGRLRTPVV